jgi:hypothetical protein
MVRLKRSATSGPPRTGTTATISSRCGRSIPFARRSGFFRSAGSSAREAIERTVINGADKVSEVGARISADRAAVIGGQVDVAQRALLEAVTSVGNRLHERLECLEGKVDSNDSRLEETVKVGVGQANELARERMDGIRRQVTGLAESSANQSRDTQAAFREQLSDVRDQLRVAQTEVARETRDATGKAALAIDRITELLHAIRVQCGDTERSAQDALATNLKALRRDLTTFKKNLPKKVVEAIRELIDKIAALNRKSGGSAN